MEGSECVNKYRFKKPVFLEIGMDKARRQHFMAVCTCSGS